MDPGVGPAHVDTSLVHHHGMHQHPKPVSTCQGERYPIPLMLTTSPPPQPLPLAKSQHPNDH